MSSLETAREQAHAIVGEIAAAAGIERKPKAKKPPTPEAKLAAAIAKADAPKEAKPKAEKKAKTLRPVCQSTKKDGQPCTAHCMADVPYCTDHRPAVQHLTEAEVGTLKAAMLAAPDSVAWVVEQLGWGKARLLAAKLRG